MTENHALLIDVGNTLVKWALIPFPVPEHFSIDLHTGQADHDIFLREKIGQFLSTSKLKKICISNVAGPYFADEIINQIGSAVPCKFISSRDKQAGVENAYQDPVQLGSDRWLAMIAAYQIVKDAVCVVDFGTAITIDMISATGKHQGGVIIPGFELLRTCMKRLDSLPHPSKLEETPPLLGTNTQSAMLSGFQNPVKALVEKLTQQNQSQQSPVSLVVTGGQARYSGLLDLPKTQYRPHLVLEGLVCQLQISNH